MNSEVIVIEDDLPNGWIKRQSKRFLNSSLVSYDGLNSIFFCLASRPNLNYYFNTATGKSQWTEPTSPDDKHRTKSSQKGLKDSSPCGNHSKISGESKRSKFYGNHVTLLRVN